MKEDPQALIARYEKVAKDSIRHHWVPQCHLNNFSIPSDEGSVFVYQRGTAPFSTNTINVAVKNNLYTFKEKDTDKATRAMEGIFSEHEGKVAPILRDILATESLPADELVRSELAVFVSMLRVRGPSFAEWLKDMDAEHVKLLNKAWAENPSALRQKFEEASVTPVTEEEFEETRKFMIDGSRYDVEMTGGKEHYFKQAMKLSKDIYEIFMTKKSWHLLVAPEKCHFITSDNPVVIQEPEDCPPHLSGGLLNGTVLLTLSPRICLALRRVPLKKEKIFLSREDVDSINRSIAAAARKQLYGHLDSKDIARLCEEVLEGDGSSVTIKRLAPFAPYYITQGKAQYKEAEGIKRHST